jgi:hypothetical protein
MIFRKRIKLDMEAARKLVPIRAPGVEWTPHDGGINVTVRRTPGRMASLLARFFTVPETRTIALDSVGARVWELCDGATPVSGIVSALSGLHGWDEEKTEKAVLQFLIMLSERMLVGFASERQGLNPLGPRRETAG